MAEAPNAFDDRWGDNVPWRLRYSISFSQGDYVGFFSRVGKRLSNLLEHNDAGLRDSSQFLDRLEVESLGVYRVNRAFSPWLQITRYFSDELADDVAKKVKDERMLGSRVPEDELRTKYWHQVIGERLEVLQSFLVLLPKYQQHNITHSLVRDLRRAAAASGTYLDFKGQPATIIPIEEPLMQKEVLDRLLPRLEAKYPARAADLTTAYHDLLRGVDTNTIFGNAFKALEALAGEITGQEKLELKDRRLLDKHFPVLHGTIKETIVKLAAHRGDEGAHGRKGPDDYEIRYLLFTICNVALLMLEYKESGLQATETR